MKTAIEKHLEKFGQTVNSFRLAGVKWREAADAAREKSLVKRQELGMGKTGQVKLGMKPNAHNEAKLANANERAAKQGLVKKR
jgi:hypothetical protein